MFKPKAFHIKPTEADQTPTVYETHNADSEQKAVPHNTSAPVTPIRPIEARVTSPNLQPSTPTVATPATMNKPVTEFNGEKIENLEATGFQTISLLKVAGNTVDKNKQRFNLPILESIPLSLVFRSFEAVETSDNFHFNGFDFGIKENKWYNKTERRGNINAISLTKQLIAIKEDLNEQDNQKSLFIASCKHLSSLQLELQNKEEINEEIQPNIKLPPAPVVEENKDTQDNKNKPIDWKQLTEQLNNIPLVSVMEYLGANANEDGHRGKWKIYRTGHNIQVTNNMWKNWNTNEGGHGAISLLAEYISIVESINMRDPDGKKFARKLAIKELMKEFGSDFDSSLVDTGSPVFKVPFAMPHVIDFKINEVRNYLHEKRGIPLWIINKQIDTGNLFAGFPSDWKPNPHLKNPDKLKDEYVWAVFLATNGNAAEMRGIDRYDNYAKILASGSDKSVGGFLLKAERNCTEKTVTALEAAIDSMSYHAFYPGRVAMSCMGVNFGLAVNSALEALEAGYKFQLGFDNDLAGNEAAVSFKEKLSEEISEETYKEYITNGKIKLFDLGIKVLEETINNDDIFYFDVKNNDRGREAVLMFREQLFNAFSKETIRQWESKGKIKYINVCPAFELIQDPKLEAQQVFDLLESGKPYYLRSVEDPEEKPEVKQTRIAFEDAIMALAKDRVEVWKDTGRLIFSKDPIAKDWNEFFLYKKDFPEFQATLREQEETYIGYTVKETAPIKSKKSI